MSNAGEKLYGDWERRISEQAGPFSWRGVFGDIALATLALGVWASALFGFR